MELGHERAPLTRARTHARTHTHTQLEHPLRSPPVHTACLPHPHGQPAHPPRALRPLPPTSYPPSHILQPVTCQPSNPKHTCSTMATRPPPHPLASPPTQHGTPPAHHPSHIHTWNTSAVALLLLAGLGFTGRYLKCAPPLHKEGEEEEEQAACLRAALTPHSDPGSSLDLGMELGQEAGAKRITETCEALAVAPACWPPGCSMLVTIWATSAQPHTMHGTRHTAHGTPHEWGATHDKLHTSHLNTAHCTLHTSCHGRVARRKAGGSGCAPSGVHTYIYNIFDPGGNAQSSIHLLCWPTPSVPSSIHHHHRYVWQAQAHPP